MVWFKNKILCPGVSGFRTEQKLILYICKFIIPICPDVFSYYTEQQNRIIFKKFFVNILNTIHWTYFDRVLLTCLLFTYINMVFGRIWLHRCIRLIKGFPRCRIFKNEFTVNYLNVSKWSSWIFFYFIITCIIGFYFYFIKKKKIQWMGI